MLSQTLAALTLSLTLLSSFNMPRVHAGNPVLFKQTSISYDQTGSVTTGDVLELTLSFQPWQVNVTAGDLVYFRLPRFSTSTYRMGTEGGAAGGNVAALELSPSTVFTGTWTEGTWCASCDNPYNASLITLQVRDLNAFVDNTLQVVRVFKSNGIRAYCGSPTNWDKLMIGTNSSSALPGTTVQWQSIETSPLVGNGCQDKSSCNLHGKCDYCYNICNCDRGYGHPETEIFEYGSVRIDCGERTCPSGVSVMDLPISKEQGHFLKECSNNGICERQLGQCECFEGWGGLACHRRECPNKCSGHGICASMREMSGMKNAFPLSGNETIYGRTDESRNGSAWDYDSMYGCVCDSSWPVGLGRNEWQKAEWFGPDCSLRRCPSGDDPMTAVNETDCEGKTAEGGNGVGLQGNLCYTECSNRGVCVYEEGVGRCKCFPGFLGDNCGTMSAYGGTMGEWFDPTGME